MPTERMFIAVALPDPIKAALAELEESLDGVGWVRTSQFHLTLRFLGEIETDATDRIGERLATIRVEPFLLPVEGVGAFPPKGPPRVIWAGVGRGHPRLHQLRQRLDDALLSAGLGDLDVRFFQPHVTLGRCSESSEASVSRWLRAHREFAGPSFRVDSFDLYASRPAPDGTEHLLKRRFLLN